MDMTEVKSIVRDFLEDPDLYVAVASAYRGIYNALMNKGFSSQEAFSIILSFGKAGK